MRYSKIFFTGLFVSCLTTRAGAEDYAALHFGLSASKSILGLSYSSGRNEVNAGLKGFAFTNSGDYAVRPGLTYNRTFTENGWYGGLGYAPEYRDGWDTGDFMLGLGKSFQWPSWGLNVDANLLTAADGEFARTWGYWLGAGASYRFKLE